MNLLTSSKKLFFDAVSRLGRGNDNEFHIYLMGVNKSGKTSLLKELKVNQKRLNAKLIFDDQPSGGMRRSHLLLCSDPIDGIIYMIDASKPDSFPDNKRILHTLLNYTFSENKVPVLILVNKSKAGENSWSEKQLRNYLQFPNEVGYLIHDISVRTTAFHFSCIHWNRTRATKKVLSGLLANCQNL